MKSFVIAPPHIDTTQGVDGALPQILSLTGRFL